MFLALVLLIAWLAAIFVFGPAGFWIPLVVLIVIHVAGALNKARGQ